MQLSLVMMLAITGLGCHNKTSVGIDAVQATDYQVDSAPLASYQGSGSSPSSYAAPTPYPDIPSRLYTKNLRPQPTDWHAEIRSTLCSFVLGHDPDVTTIREIEASVYGVDSAQ
jgi:hypothetical protein